MGALGEAKIAPRVDWRFGKTEGRTEGLEEGGKEEGIYTPVTRWVGGFW